jgi:uncharacterized protein (UPF0264 family)
MTLFLASVRDAVEAEMALACGVDIIDLKDPSRGALGAVSPDAIAATVRSVGGRAPVSATIGDLLLKDVGIGNAVRATAATGVNFVKVGLFPGTEAEDCFSLLAAEASQARVILVVFADALPEFDATRVAATIGATGMMLDTMDKAAGSLPDHLSTSELGAFVHSVNAEGLIVGLAGSLKAKHVPPLLALDPDLLGFRGALCRAGARQATVDPVAAASIRALIPRMPSRLPGADSPALATQALC